MIKNRHYRALELDKVLQLLSRELMLRIPGADFEYGAQHRLI